MRVLITGGAGYIGSVMTRVFQDAGHAVVVLDNFSQGHKDAIPATVQVLEGDVAEIGQLLDQCEPVDAIVHLAAYISVGESMQQPELYWNNNVTSTLSMLEVMRSRNITQLVFASSAAVYGNPETIPITEDMPTKPTNTYGMTKLAMDMAITSECWAHGLAATSLRFFNVAGAYKDAGERHKSETHIIPLAFDALTGKRELFTIFGQDYPTEDGTCVRDYIHVADLARAAMLSLEHNAPGEHHIYNLGNGNGFSNKHVVETIEAVTGLKMPLQYGSRREGDPATLIASSKRAHDELGWQPQRGDLKDIIADAWNFYREAESAQAQ